MDIHGKPIIVTGGASGIGRAIATYLAEAGAIVAIFDQNRQGLDETCRSINSAGGECLGYQTDITDYKAVLAAVAEFGKASQSILYALVNNAGWDRAMPFIETTPEFWDQVIAINLKGPINVTHACLTAMVEQGQGRVISIASDAARVGSSGEAVYSAAKAGIIALMKTLAREHTRHGITFNSICPGPTDTPLLATFDEDGSGKLASALERAIPMRRLAQPSDFPALVAYFLSPEAGYVTGQTISVSGGLTMHG
jgi:2-hydroxycyclohexanecarboxyl-CoA dehydrogenase